MPDKILGAISPAYGIATGTGPYKHFLGKLGRDHYDKKVNEREEEARVMREKKELDEARRKIERQSSAASSGMSAGGRVGKKSIDGKAVRGMTRGRFV